MTSQVRIKDKRVYVGEEGRALLSGEVHYWRLLPENWQAALAQVAALGLRVVSTYVCWEYHELAPGEYDFSGHSAAGRDLPRFLQWAQAQGLWVILRPGPYIYAEWVNNGVPARVAHLHRLHPDFIAAAQDYLRALLPVIVPYLAVNGGPVVLLQADNEPDAWTGFYARQLGLEDEPGVFQAYLHSAYAGNLERLNARWETALTDFQQARAVMTPAVVERGWLNRYLDYRRFLYWYSGEIVRGTAEFLRAELLRLGAAGMPLLANHYPHHITQDWRALEAHADISGIDYYSHNEFSRDSWEHAEFLHLLRYMRTYAALPFIAEFQSGIWHGWHQISGVLTARHYQLAGVSALLAGVAGWNWYMLVNRDNWYMSPVNEWGRAHPELLDVFQRLVALFNAVDPPALTKLSDTAVALDILDRSAEIGGFDDPLRSACYYADVDYECYDLATGALSKPLLLYSGHRWLEESAQRRLLAYVEAGGNLVFFDQLPVLDADLRPCNLLGLHEPNGILGGADVTVMLGDHTCAVSAARLFRYDAVADEAVTVVRRIDSSYHAEEERIHFHLPEGTRHCTGYRESRGAGSIIVLGMPPSPPLLLALHRWLRVPLYSRAALDGVSTALFRREQAGEYCLIVANNRPDAVESRVRLDDTLFAGKLLELHDLWTGATRRCQMDTAGAAVQVSLPGKAGTALRLLVLKSPQ